MFLGPHYWLTVCLLINTNSTLHDKFHFQYKQHHTHIEYPAISFPLSYAQLQESSTRVYRFSLMVCFSVAMWVSKHYPGKRPRLSLLSFLK